MRTILIGAVDSSAIALTALNEAGYPPALLVTFDADIGPRRHGDYVDLAGRAAEGTEILFVRDINDPGFVARVREIGPDAMFVIGWSRIAGPELRAAAGGRVIGFHPTALPKHRGRAPIAWTILLGLDESAGSLFLIDEGVDSGPILAQRRFVLEPRETVQSLFEKHGIALRAMIRDLLPRLASGDWAATPQDHGRASYCARRMPEDGLIDWWEPAAAIDRLIRASGRPYPGAFTFTRGRRVTIWAAEPLALASRHFANRGQIVLYDEGRPVVLCGDGALLRITEYETEDAAPLSGQLRFLDRPGQGGKELPR